MECTKRNFDHIRFDLAPLVSDHVCFIYQVKLTQSTTLEQKRFDLRSLSPALPTLITSNYDKFLLVIIIIFFKNVSLPFTLPSSKNRYLFLLQTGLPHLVMDQENAIMVNCQKTGRASRRWCASTGHPTTYRPAGGLDLDAGLVVFSHLSHLAKVVILLIVVLL